MSLETYAAVRVSKSFSGVTVLDQVDFEIRASEVHAVLGENGSGKTTLIKILGGAHAPTTGHVERDGKRIDLPSPTHAQRAGLAIVHQEFQLFPHLDVATNVALTSDLPRRRLTRTLDRREMRRRAAGILSNLGLGIDPRELVRNLRLAEWKLVEIARALMARSSFLVLDEPTALLDRRDSRSILALIERLREEGVGIAFVTHKLDEALSVADRITVLRDGKLVASSAAGDATAADLVELIVGRKGLREEPKALPRAVGNAALELRGGRAAPGARPFDLEVRRGEIVGLTGLVGSGALEVARMIAGRRPLTGTLTIDGRERRIASPSEAIAAGIGYIPEERASYGIVSQMSVELNISLASLPDVSPGGLLHKARVRSRARKYAAEMAIRGPSLRAPVRTLSGGNQQKVQIAKWLAPSKRILVVESPTHGVDVGAKMEIHRLLVEFAASGGSIVVASTDIPEVLSIADRVAVFSHGELVEVIRTSETSHGQVLLSGARDRQVDKIEHLIER